MHQVLCTDYCGPVLVSPRLLLNLCQARGLDASWPTRNPSGLGVWLAAGRKILGQGRTAQSVARRNDVLARVARAGSAVLRLAVPVPQRMRAAVDLYFLRLMMTPRPGGSRAHRAGWASAATSVTVGPAATAATAVRQR